jgi:hypothetical protein
LKNLKNGLLALCIFGVVVILGGIVSELAADAILTAYDLFENTMGAVVTSVGLFVIVGLPLAYFAKRKGLERNQKTMALWGLLSGALSMASLILLIDGLPLYFPQDILLIAFVGLGGAISAFAWATFSTRIKFSDA